MGTIKIEFELPEFDNELSVSLTIHKDKEGGVKLNTSSSPMNIKTEIVEDKPVFGKTENKEIPPTTTIPKRSGRGGNMMGIEI